MKQLPSPLSLTEMQTQPSTSSHAMTMEPPAGVNLTALAARLRTICRVRSRSPLNRGEGSDELIQAAAQDAEQERRIRELDLGSYLCVPLVARDQVLGALTFVSGRAGRRFGTRDLWMAEQLARRAAVAIDNARLFAESQETRYRLEETATELEAQTEELQAQACQLEDAQVELELSNDAPRQRGGRGARRRGRACPRRSRGGEPREEPVSRDDEP